MRVGSFNGLSRVRWGIALLPLDTAANAGSLGTLDRLAGEHCLDGGAEITAGDWLVVAGSALIELSMVGQSTIATKKIEFWGAGSAIGLRDLLCLVVTEWKGKAPAYGHFFELRRCIIGIVDRVIAADGNAPQARVVVVTSKSGKFLLDMHHIGTVLADEHDEQPCLGGERVEGIPLPTHHVMQGERGCWGTKLEYGRSHSHEVLSHQACRREDAACRRLGQVAVRLPRLLRHH